MTAAVMARDSGNVFVALAQLARSLPGPALVSLEALGLLLALALFAWTPGHWPFVLPCLSVSAFGLWGVCDHLIASRPGHPFRMQRRMLRWFQSTIATVGTAAALYAVFLLVGWAMGVYIS